MDRIVVAGPPCAGKTTWARATGLPVLDLDDLAVRIGSTRRHNHSRRVYDAASRLYEARVRALAASSRPVVLIRSAATAAERDLWAARIGASRVVVLIPAIAVLEQRARQRASHTRRTLVVIGRWMRRYTAGPEHEVVGSEPRVGRGAVQEQRTSFR